MVFATSDWFVVVTGISLLGLCLGLRAGQSTRWVRRLTLLFGGCLLALWVLLIQRPSVAVQVMPLDVLSHLEGVGAVPFFMLIIGTVWSSSKLMRERRLSLFASALGAIYLVNGGLWMLQCTPNEGFENRSYGGVVMQSKDYTCVPAACATALQRMGIDADEKAMAHLTNTRAGTGSTLIRAMAGLEQRLENTGIEVMLLEPNYDELRHTPMPVLTPLRYKATYKHMVTLMYINDKQVWVGDPTEGLIILKRDKFLEVYTGEIIAFDQPRLRNRHCSNSTTVASAQP